MRRRFIYFVIIWSFMFVLPQPKAEAAPPHEKIIMSGTRKENSRSGRFLKLTYTEAFKRIDKELVYRFYPAKRGSIMTDRGKVDGELDRIYNYNEKHPTLIRVEEPILSMRFCAFSTDPAIKLSGWDSLIDKEYIVEYVFGIKICADNLPKVVNKGKLLHVYYWEQGIRNLVNKRTDIYIDEEGTVKNALKSGEFKNARIHLAGVMEENSIHAFLQLKYKTLALMLSTALAEMKKEGLIQKFIKESNLNKDHYSY